MSASEFLLFVLLVLVTVGLAEPNLSPVPDMYPNLVIVCSFLWALPVLEHAITVL